MGRIANYSNTHKYSNRQSFDGKPVEAGKVLVPFRQDTFNLKKSDYIQDNFTTMTLGEFTYELGFMPIPEEHFASYMKDFWNDINEDLKMRREGRCVLTNPDGTERLCPNTRRCKNCPHKGLLERRNPNRVDIMSLNYEFEGESFAIESRPYRFIPQDGPVEEGGWCDCHRYDCAFDRSGCRCHYRRYAGEVAGIVLHCQGDGDG